MSFDRSLPNFFIIGAERAGTTSLYTYLKQHPDIFMSDLKEPGFFAMIEELEWTYCGPGDELIPGQRITRWEDYRALFSTASSSSAVGEASTIYLYHPRVAERLKRHVPDAKCIVLLRDPVERARSHFRMMRRMGREPLERFEDAVGAEERRIRQGWGMGWHYLSKGRYAGQLKRYFDCFDASRIRVYLTEDLEGDPARVIRGCFSFLGVAETFTPDRSARHNRGDTTSQPPRVEPRLRAELIQDCRADIQELEKLINRDLSAWMTP